MDFFVVLDLFFLRDNFFSNSVFKSSKQIGFVLFCISCTLPQRGSRKKAFRIPIWDATVAKLVDAIGLGPIGRNAVLVRVQSVAPSLRPTPSVLRSAHAGTLSFSLPLSLPLRGTLFSFIPLIFLSASEAIFLMGQGLLHFAGLREFLFCYAFFKYFSRILQLSHQGFFRFNAKISSMV